MCCSSKGRKPPFLKFLEAGVASRGFEVDDVLAAVLPLMKQVVATHETRLVAPFDGMHHLLLSPEGQLMFASERSHPPKKNSGQVEALQTSVSGAVEVIAHSRRTTDIDHGTHAVSDLGIGSTDAAITRPVFLPHYRSWEHCVGHHDELTDIFSLGMLLASVSCGLDFSDAGELELFTLNRTNLFAIAPRLNPVYRLHARPHDGVESSQARTGSQANDFAA